MATCPDGHESTSADFCDTCGMRIEGAPATVAGAGSGSSGSSGGEVCPQCGTDRNGQFCEACGFDYTTGTPSLSPGGSSSPDPLSGLGSPDPLGAQPDPAGAQPDPAAGQPDPFAAASGSVPAGQDPYGPATGLEPTTSPANPAPAAGQDPSAPAGQGAAPDPAATAGPSWTATVNADHDYYEAIIAAGGPDAASIEFPSYCPERKFTLTGQEVRIGRRSASRGLEPEIDLTGPPTDPGISHLHAVLIAAPDGWSVLDPGSSNGTQVNGDDILTGVPHPLHDGDRVCLGAWTVLTIAAP